MQLHTGLYIQLVKTRDECMLRQDFVQSKQPHPHQQMPQELCNQASKGSAPFALRGKTMWDLYKENLQELPECLATLQDRGRCRADGALQSSRLSPVLSPNSDLHTRGVGVDTAALKHLEERAGGDLDEQLGHWKFAPSQCSLRLDGLPMFEKQPACIPLELSMSRSVSLERS